MRAERVRRYMKRWGSETHDCELHDELDVRSEISSSVSLTMSMNYVHNVQLCFLHQRLSALMASLTISIFGNSTLSCEPDRPPSTYELAESRAFVTYIITNATVSTPPPKCRLIVLSVKCRTGELGTLPDNLLDSIQEISFSSHFSS